MPIRRLYRALRAFSLAPLPSVVTLFDATRPWDYPYDEDTAR